jgi:hypothetical protein
MTSTENPNSLPFPESGYEILAAGLGVIAEIGIDKWVNEYGFERNFIVKFRNGLLLSLLENAFEPFGRFVKNFETDGDLYDEYRASARITKILSVLANEIVPFATLEEVRNFWRNLSRCFASHWDQRVSK